MLQFKPFEPADRLAEKDRGDTTYQYLVSRLFNFNASWDEGLEQRAGILEIEKKRVRKIDRIYKLYQGKLSFLLLLAVAGWLMSIFFRKQIAPKLIGLALFGSFAGSYSVYLLITLFAVPAFDRLLAIVSISLLCFTGYFIALVIQFVMERLFSGTKVFLNKVGSQ
ncbi:MAG: hypothetical protein GY694_01240 [Gammaproteobacteria bacterium]|nr:hypothetical protein [Gammaproteobacteria bacterium]